MSETQVCEHGHLARVCLTCEQADEIIALRARVAELEEANTRLAELLVLCAAWAAKAEAVRVAAWGHITTWPDDDPDPVATARLRTALSSCPPLESITKAALVAEEEEER